MSKSFRAPRDASYALRRAQTEVFGDSVCIDEAGVEANINIDYGIIYQS